MSCSSQLGLGLLGPCGGHGECLGNQTCLCEPGFSPMSDWLMPEFDSCLTHGPSIDTVATILAASACAVLSLVFYKLHVLVKERRKDARIPIEPIYITISFAFPVLSILLYELVLLFSRQERFLMRSAILVSLFTLTHFGWQISSFLVNRWLIRRAYTVASTVLSGSEPESKAKVLQVLVALVNCISFFSAMSLLVILYVTKAKEIFRIYCVTMCIYVLVHIIPYYYARQSEKDIEEYMATYHTTGTASGLVSLSQSHRHTKQLKNLFLASMIYFYNLIFAIFEEFSPWYLQVTFVVGIFFWFGLLRHVSISRGDSRSEEAPKCHC